MQTNKLLLFVFLSVLLTINVPTHLFAQNSTDKFIVVIDPGHGGRDTGTPGTGRYKATEKDIALDVSLSLGKMLETINGVAVKYTRTKDVFPTLQSRPITANNADADLFISIHCNAQPGKKGTASGSETFVLGLHKEALNLEVVKRENSVIKLEENYKERYQDFDPTSPESLLMSRLAFEEYLDQSIELARYIEDEFKTTAKRKSRGVKQAGFWVLAYTSMPSVLVELGFLTHKKEEDFLNSKRGKELMTKSLFNAIKQYYEHRMVNSSLEEVVVVEDDIEKAGDPLVYNNVVFKVQIAASSRKLEPKGYNFKGLDEVSREKEGNLYKYFYGYTSDYNKIKQYQSKAKSKGYNSSFIVAYKGGVKIDLADALKSEVN